MLALEIVFWVCVALLVHTHLGYPLTLWLLSRAKRGAPGGPVGEQEYVRQRDDQLPSVSLIVAAHDEGEVIERKLGEALALDYPRERLELIVASDGSEDRTAELARTAGADVVLELPRIGKLAAQNAAVEPARGEVLAFSDANSRWEPAALRALVGAVARPGVGYACGALRFLNPDGSNQEDAYWRYELWVRGLESRLAGVTAGNGAIYAVRREAYMALEASRSHDLSFPFELTKRGWLAVFTPEAVAEEKPVPMLEGEFRRKRRMMRGLWDIVVRDGMISPRGYPPLYAYEIASHRLLRYLSPLLHLVALGVNVALLGEGWVYTATLIAQLAFLAAAALGSFLPFRPLRLANYYVLVTASIVAGLWDRLRAGTPAAWEKAEGTR
jgi:cellulose synthase/poly-beta-1,6-N-acetylglucosamine synthase-like glycosyltransferase